MTRNGRRAGRARLAVSAALLLVTAGCSGGEEPGGADEAPSLREPGQAPTLEVEPVTTSGRLVGGLPRRDRAAAEKHVARVAVRWMDEAYLGDRYPRRSFRSSFAVFTGGARVAARRDAGRLTNRRIGTRVDEVTPTAIGVEVDLLAVRKRAVSATAHVRLRFRTEGKVSRRFRVSGRLMMTRREGRWRVFAYDVARVHVGARAQRPNPPDRDRAGRPEARKDRARGDRRTRGGRG